MGISSFAKSSSKRHMCLLFSSQPEMPILTGFLGLKWAATTIYQSLFLPRELVIRANKLLNRVYGSNQKKTDTITLTPYEIDLHTRTVSENGKPIDLTSKEFDFLVTISKDLGQAFSREQLLNLIWGEDYFGTDRVVDDLVRRVRKKCRKHELKRFTDTDTG